MNAYRWLALLVLAVHLAWILWVLAGCWLARSKTLARLHIASLLYSIFIETSGWYCPLTYLEQWAQARAGLSPYRSDFLIHYLNSLIYPDIPQQLLVALAVAVCGFNLGVHAWRACHSARKRSIRSTASPT